MIGRPATVFRKTCEPLGPVLCQMHDGARGRRLLAVESQCLNGRLSQPEDRFQASRQSQGPSDHRRDRDHR